MRLYMMILLLPITLLAYSVKASDIQPKTIEANGAELTYVEQGSGPLLILAHGATSDHQRWMKDHMPSLAENYRVVSYSMRYHGTSEWDENWPDLSMQLYSDDLAAFITALESGPAHIVGWSMGARVVHTTALKYPELVRSAYMFEGAAALDMDDTQSAEFDTVFMESFGETVALSKDGKYAESVGALMDAVTGQPGFFAGLPEEVQKVEGEKGELLEKITKVYEEPRATYTCEQMKDSTVPMKLTIGDSTAAYFAGYLGEILKPCLGDNTQTIEDANHVWPAAKIDDFIQSVHEFASKH